MALGYWASESEAVFLQVHLAVGYGYALLLKPLLLAFDASEAEVLGKPSLGVHYPVARDYALVGVHMEYVAHHPGKLWVAKVGGKVSVGGDLALRDQFDGVVDIILEHQNSAEPPVTTQQARIATTKAPG